jgi:hypothetical protein
MTVLAIDFSDNGKWRQKSNGTFGVEKTKKCRGKRLKRHI